MNDLQLRYYREYEKLIKQIVQSGKMTFFNKADLLEKMDEDLQEKIKNVKAVDFSC